MLCRDGRVKLIDFGAAKQIIDENKTAVVKSGFTPIEQYTSKSKQGAWTDVYSLGATMYYMLTKNELDIPYDREQDDSDFDKNIIGISENLRKLIRKAVMIKADERYRDMIGFRSDLEKAEAEPLAVELTDDLISWKENASENISDASAEDVPVINEDGKNEYSDFGAAVAVEEKEDEKAPADIGVTVAVKEKEDEKAPADFGVTVMVDEKENDFSVPADDIVKELSDGKKSEKKAEAKKKSKEKNKEKAEKQVKEKKKSDDGNINKDEKSPPKKKKLKLLSVISGAVAAVAAVVLFAVFRPEPIQYGKEPAAKIIKNYDVEVGNDMINAANEISEKLGFNLLIIYGGDEEAGMSVSRYAKECYKKTFKGSGAAICFSEKESEAFTCDFSIYYHGECSDIYEKNEEIKNDIYETVKGGVGTNLKHRWAVLKFCSLLEDYYDGELSAEATTAKQTVKTTTHKTTTIGTTTAKIATTTAETTTSHTTTAETTTTPIITTAEMTTTPITTAETITTKITTTASETTTTHKTTTAATTQTTAAAAKPLKVKLDSEYNGDWNSTQNSISKADFEKIGGDVKVTLEIEVVSNEYSLLIPLDTENGWQHITGLSFIECDGVQDDGWVGINIENPVCVFIVPEQVIKGMTNRGMDFQVCGLIIKSALLEKAE